MLAMCSTVPDGQVARFEGDLPIADWSYIQSFAHTMKKGGAKRLPQTVKLSCSCKIAAKSQ